MAGKLKDISRRFGSFYRHSMLGFNSRIDSLRNIFGVATFVMSVAVVAVLLVWVGFEHADKETAFMLRILAWAQGVFTVTILFELIFRKRREAKWGRIFRWVVNAGVLLLVLPALYPQPEHPWLPWLEKLLYSPRLRYGILAAYSVLDISSGVMRLMGRRTNPSMLLGGSFVVFIFVGSLVLMMPRCTYHGISFIDSLFVSGSAVCITGLTPVDIASTFTPLGQTVLAILFQLGALGIITFTSFFAIFFSGNQSIYSQLLMKDVIYSKSMNALLPTLLYILGFTLFVEAIGAAAIYFTIPDSLGMDFEAKASFSVFQSMSSFCNVGFTNVKEGLSNTAFMTGNQSIYIVVTLLVFAGGVGFPILVNLKEVIAGYLKKFKAKITGSRQPIRPVHIYDLNTKVVLVTTVSLFILGAAAFFILESGNTMKGMSMYERIVQSFFNASTPRSSGFSSVNPANFLNITLIIVMFQMWIGGASQSMAGGIKVNTLGTILLNLISIVTGKAGVVAFRRNIALPSVRRANAIVTLSILTTFVFVVTVMLLEPAMSAKSVVFEVISAVFTVGTSLGATPDLSVASKCVLILAMFLGRVGLLSLMTGMFKPKHDLSPHYPSEKIVIS